MFDQVIPAMSTFEPHIDDFDIESIHEGLRDLLAPDFLVSMFQTALEEFQQDDFLYDPPEPVAPCEYTPPPLVTPVATVQQTIFLPEEPASVSVPVSAFFEALEDFSSDQHQLAPITSIAGYLEFKKQFDALASPLVARHILDAHSRDVYFFDALHLMSSDRVAIETALVASSFVVQHSLVDRADNIIRSHFTSVPEVIRSSTPAYIADPTAFAARSPPSCSLFNFSSEITSTCSYTDDGDVLDHTLCTDIHHEVHSIAPRYAYDKQHLPASDRQFISPLSFTPGVPIAPIYVASLSFPSPPSSHPFDFDPLATPASTPRSLIHQDTLPPVEPVPERLSPSLSLPSPVQPTSPHVLETLPSIAIDPIPLVYAGASYVLRSIRPLPPESDTSVDTAIQKALPSTSPPIQHIQTPQFRPPKLPLSRVVADRAAAPSPELYISAESSLSEPEPISAEAPSLPPESSIASPSPVARLLSEKARRHRPATRARYTSSGFVAQRSTF